MFIQDPLTDPRKPDVNEVPILKTFDDIIAHFATISVDRSRGWDVTPVGEACWKLVGFNVTVGTNEIAPLVRKADGSYLPDKEVNWHFPGVPDSASHDLHPPYFARGLSARTKGHPDNNGAHFTVTGDHNVAPGGAGPDSVWVAAEPGWPGFSDAVHGLGMRVNTNHLIVSPIFQFVIKGEDEPGGGGPSPAAGKAHLEVVVDGQSQGRISLNPAGPGALPVAGELTLAIVVGGQEVGHITLGAAASGGNALVLRDGAAELGRIPWQPNE
jgi:hypothetical protein